MELTEETSSPPQEPVGPDTSIRQHTQEEYTSSNRQANDYGLRRTSIHSTIGGLEI